jgi:hypothetical protein
MNRISFVLVRSLVLWFLIILIAPVVHAQTTQSNSSLPPISQQLVREGDFAVKLHQALGLGTVDDEAEAENGLGKAGVIPRNGWIADYPVTPDIFGELQKSVGDAADAGKIALNKNDALQKLDSVSSDLALAIKPYTGTGSAPYGEAVDETAAADYPNPTEVNDYYQTEGPPIITYYSPPPDYYYLYGWIPYPFWWSGFWFPGYFILHDFYRPFHFHNRVGFVSNHFNDVRSHRVFRVDPVSRFNGRTFAGIGVTNRRGFISTGVPRSQRTIFNAPRAQASPGMRAIPGMRPSYRTSGTPGRSLAPANRSGATTFSAPSRGFGGGGARSTPAPASGGGAARSFSAPSRGGGGYGGGTGGRMSAPSGGGGMRR